MRKAAGSLVALAGCALMLAVTWAVPARTLTAQEDQALAVIAHPSVPNEPLRAVELQNVFLRQKLTWSNGVYAVPINYDAGHPLRVSFDRAVLGMSPHQAARFWVDARIRGAGQAPRSVGSPALLARVIPKLRGSIGYLPSNMVPPGVHVLARIAHGEVRAP